MDHPYWLGHLFGGESSVVKDNQSSLSVEASDDGKCLVYESASSITLRQIEIRVTSACLALLHLALYPDEDRAISETWVRIAPTEPWLTVYGSAFHAEPDLQTARTTTPFLLEFGPRGGFRLFRARRFLRGRQLRRAEFPVDLVQIGARPVP